VDDESCLVTVVGARRRVDLSVPAHAAIAEYAPALLTLCGQEQTGDAFPPVWSLALPGGRPLSPETSLVAAGVADGATLYLRDCAAGEYDGPIVTDLDELVAEASTGLANAPWHARQRAASLLLLGVLGLIGALGVLIATAGTGSAGVADVAGPVAGGLVLAAAARWARRRRVQLPPGQRAAIALGAVPLFAIAALALPSVGGRLQPEVAAVCAYAAVGALLARIVVAHLGTLIVLVLAVFAMPVTAVLAAAHATLPDYAAVAAVLMLAVLGTAPGTSGYLAAMASPTRAVAPEATPEIPDLVGLAGHLLIGISLLSSMVLGAGLVVLGVSHSAFAVGLAGCVGLALLLRSCALHGLAVALPPLTAGLTGLAVALAHAPGAFGLRVWIGPLALAVIAVLAAVIGLIRLLIVADSDRGGSAPAGLTWFLFAVSVPLALGVFGVLGHLLHFGESL
jgi:type VII secretion integral membrane protein EccD